jgi:hypothetical protein
MAMTNAERQRRYRARKKATKPKITMAALAKFGGVSRSTLWRRGVQATKVSERVRERYVKQQNISRVERETP